MANTIQIKRASSNASTTEPTGLAHGEFALLQAEKKLFIGRHNGSTVENYHIPSLDNLSAGNGITKTAESAAANNNDYSLAVNITDSSIYADNTNKGIASFHSDNFTVTSGAVTIKDNGIALGAETTGNFVDNVTGGTGVTVTGSAGEGWEPAIAIGQDVATDQSPAFVGLDLSGNMTIEGGITGDHSSNNLVIASTNADVLVEGTTFSGNNVTVAGSGVTTLGGAPTQDLHAATKAYVDAVKTGLDIKDSVRAATTANITISTALNNADEIDGVTLATNDRVLVKNQSTASQNGIYVVKASPSRATDFDADAEVTSGAFVFVEEGTTNGSEGWMVTTTGDITVGSTAIAFAQFSAAGVITAGAGLTKTGHSVDVVGTADRITVNADDINIATTYVGQNTITTLGTIATGTWEGTKVDVARGGTDLASYTAGDLVYASAGTTIAKLGIGADGKILQSNGSAPVWADIDGGTF
jgi:hypothetical protein|tara:strand:- start:237 stop:1652 length:1416 start_codon:yes stop_codon:yes gene_type:complete